MVIILISLINSILVIEMKILVVFYSRTGNTRIVAEEIRNGLDCDIEEIIDKQKRSGILGYWRSVYDAIRKKETVLEKIKNDPEDFDLLIIGTPVWNRNVSVPIRTYITQNHAKFNKLAFFCTATGPNFEGAIKGITELSNMSPIATLGIRAKEIKDRSYQSKIQEFVKAVQ